MPVAQYQMPDGRIAEFEVPEGTSAEQAQSYINNFDFSSVAQPTQQQPEPDMARKAYRFVMNDVAKPYINEPIAKVTSAALSPFMAGISKDAAAKAEEINNTDTGQFIGDALMSASNWVGNATDKAGNYIGNKVLGKVPNNPNANLSENIKNLYNYDNNLKEDMSALGQAAQLSGNLPMVAGALQGGIAAGSKLASKAGDIVGPSALPATTDYVNLIRAANEEGVPIPTTALTGGNNIAERLADSLQYKPYSDTINKKIVNAVGANDVPAELLARGKNSGLSQAALAGEHSTINGQVIKDAKKINGFNANKIDNAIGEVPIEHLMPELQTVAESNSIGNSAVKKLLNNIVERSQDKPIDAVYLRKITGGGSEFGKAAKTAFESGDKTLNDIQKLFKDAVRAKATPEQAVVLDDINHKFKLMYDLQDVANRKGDFSLSNTSPEAITNELTKAYNIGAEYPTERLANILKTLHPDRTTESSILGASKRANIIQSNNGLPLAEAGVGFVTGHPGVGGAVAAIQKLAPAIAKKYASKYVNSDFYRNKLLKNITPKLNEAAETAIPEAAATSPKYPPMGENVGMGQGLRPAPDFEPKGVRLKPQPVEQPVAETPKVSTSNYIDTNPEFNPLDKMWGSLSPDERIAAQADVLGNVVKSGKAKKLTKGINKSAETTKANNTPIKEFSKIPEHPLKSALSAEERANIMDEMEQLRNMGYSEKELSAMYPGFKKGGSVKLKPIKSPVKNKLQPKK